MPLDAPDPFVAALRAQLATATGGPVALRETHISWILLAAHEAWKLKRPVHLPFVDFSTPARREHACREELRLNRRLAPELYLDVVPVHGTRDAPRWAGPGPVIDHAVHMRRFADDALVGSRVDAGRLLPGQVDALARRLAAFQRDAAPADPAQTVPPEHTARRLRDQVLAPGGPREAEAAPLREWLDAACTRLAPVFRAREAAGAVRDGHGDLHLDNLVVLDGLADPAGPARGPATVTAFDALEFDPALRLIDRMADLAFATMDFRAHGRPDFAARLLAGWLDATGDFDGLRVLRFHEVCRALVRALVRRLSPADEGEGRTRPDYLVVAASLARESWRPRLLLMHGLSGSGKSALAGRLLERAGAVRVRADVERKRLAGLDAMASSRAAGLSLYGDEMNRRTRARLLEATRAGLDGGWPVIVDATTLRREDREPLRAEARARGVPFAILACEAPMPVLRARVAARSAAAGADPSEADVAVLEAQSRGRRPFDEDERRDVRVVDTSGPVDVEALARRWAAQSPGA